MGKIDTKILIDALGQGKTKVEAGRIAGSIAKRHQNVIQAVDNKIEHNSTVKRELIVRLEAHRDRIMKALEDKNLGKDPSGSLNLMLCQIVDKIELLSGNETERIGIKPIIIRETPTN